MKKNSMQFVQLILFFVVCAHGVVIGMEKELPLVPSIEVETKLPWPFDITKIILNKVMRLILDEVEDDCGRNLIAHEKRNVYSGIIAKYITGDTSRQYISPNNIDCILRLIMVNTIGVDPHIKSYKGNNVLHLLITGAFAKGYLYDVNSKNVFLHKKIELLSKCGIDFNAKNGMGNAIAHELIRYYVQLAPDLFGIEDSILFLQDLGMNVSRVKNDDGKTAYEIGHRLNNNEDPFVLVEIKLYLEKFKLKDDRRIVQDEAKALEYWQTGLKNIEDGFDSSRCTKDEQKEIQEALRCAKDKLKIRQDELKICQDDLKANEDKLENLKVIFNKKKH